jgi:hypothetical protein
MSGAVNEVLGVLSEAFKGTVLVVHFSCSTISALFEMSVMAFEMQ